MGKVVIVDMSVLAFKSIFNYELALKFHKNSTFNLPASYTYVSSLISCLKKINISSDDTVILALDDKSWRKNHCLDGETDILTEKWMENIKDFVLNKNLDKIATLNIKITV